jgi:hypothetical protein
MPTKVSLQLNPAQVRCLEKHRCFVGALAKDDSIPVGMGVDVHVGDVEATEPIAMIIVAIQEGEGDALDQYIFIRREDAVEV